MATTTTKSPTQHGIDDARAFADEHPEDAAGALEPGQLGADEALIGAMGVVATAKLFGVEPGSDAFTAACAEYNRAFDAELRRIAPEVVADAQRRAVDEQEALDAQAARDWEQLAREEIDAAAATSITNRTRIGWAYTTTPAAVGYGTEQERERAIETFRRARPDVEGTAATLPARIEEAKRNAGLTGGTYYRSELRRLDRGEWRPLTQSELDRLEQIQVSAAIRR